MKKALLSILLSSVISSFSLSAIAATNVGFVDKAPSSTEKSSKAYTTAKEAKQLRDDSWIIVRGNIIKALGDEHYLFQDSTGTLVVEIDDDEWHGQKVSPEDVVELSGETDRDHSSVELDVERVTKLSK